MKNKSLSPKNAFPLRQVHGRCRRSLWLAVGLLLSVIGWDLDHSADAAAITWTNTSGGSWSVAANWSPHLVPGSSDDVSITSAGTYTVTMDVSPTISSLTLGGASGVQTLTNTSQTLTVSHASLVEINGILGMNGGSVAGAGTLSVNGQINWNGGALNTGGSMAVAANGIMNFQASSTLLGSVNNQGTINWLGGNLVVDSNSAAGQTGTIINQAGALFDIQCDQTMLSNGAQLATFHNAGLLRKRVTAGSSSINVFLDNSSLVQAKTGTIFISVGSNLGGTSQADAGAAITFNGGTYILSSPPDFQGPGTVSMTAGDVTLSAFTGTFTLSGPNLIGQNTIASNGIINLNGTSLNTGASLLVASNAVLNIQGSITLLGSLSNQGTVNWLGGSLVVDSNSVAGQTGTIVNQAGALFDIQCDQTMFGGGAQLATFHNAGLLRKRVTSGSSSLNVFLDNSSLVQAKTGTIFISVGSNLGGTFQADAGAAISFNGGTYILSSPPDFQGPGTVSMTAGDVTLSAFTGTFTLSGPNLIGQNTIASNGIINLNGTSLNTGASLLVASNAVLNFQASSTLLGSLSNQGTINWLGGSLVVDSNSAAGQTGTIVNQAGALFDIQCDQTMFSGGAQLATFHNAGLLRKRVTAGSSLINVFLDNSSLLQAKTGTIVFTAGANLGGTFQADSGATIQFNTSSYILSGPPDFQGPGAVQFNGGNITLNAFMGTFAFNNANLIGNSTIASGGVITLNGGSLTTGASLLVLSNGVLNFQSSSTLLAPLTNQGTINWLGGSLVVDSNSAAGQTGTIVNQAGALFDIQCDQTMFSGGTQLATFHNAGLLRKRVTAGLTTFNLMLDNASGTVQGQTGTLSLSSAYAGSAEATLAIALSSTNPGTGFGKIQFSTTNSLFGKFKLVTLGGYQPNPGDSFLVLGFPGVTNDFTCMNGLDLGGGLFLAPRPSATGLTLVAANYPVTASPYLTLDHSLKGVLVGWPTNFTGWTLQTATNLVAPSWSNLPVAGTNNTVVSLASSQQFFRLFQ